MGFNFQNKPSKPVRGGSGKMFGEQTSKPSEPGKISVSHDDTDHDDGDIRVRGGTTKMCGFTGSQPAKPR